MPSPKELAKALAYRGEIRNTPQNSFLGGVANFLAPVSEFADQYKISDRIPFLGGMSAADLTGLKGAQSLVNDMSYGKSPISGASLQTTKVDPRVIDLAGVSGAMMPIGKALGKAALREGARQIEMGTGIGRAALNPRMSAVPEGASMPQRPKLQVKPPKEDIYSVADANFSMGIPSGNKTVKIGTLQGSMSSAAGDAERVKKLAGQMSADGGYIERLIVDQNGNVIEGQHRLNALRSLGVTDIPVSVIQDASPTYDLLMKSGKLRSEHARQIVRDSADMLKSEGGDVSAVLSGYDLPKGYEQYFMDAVNDLSKPKAKAMSAPDNVGGAMMQRPKPAGLLDYQIEHKPMTIEGGAAPLHDLSKSFGEDVYGKNALQYYGSGDARESGTLRLLQSLRGKPDAQVTIYRGAPSEAGGINAGDWVTLDKRVAQDYVDQALASDGKAGKVFSQKVPASHITSWPDSLMEFGYHPPAKSVPKTQYELAHEADILAGVGVGGMLDPQAIAEALRQQDRK